MKILFLASATKSTNSYPHLGMALLSMVLGRCGHTVRCIDGSAPYRTHLNEPLVDECVAFSPDIICVTATTERIKFAYHLLSLLRNRFGDTIPIIAGGPHASIRPIEMVALGFDAAVVGAAESRIVRIVDVAAKRDVDGLLAIPGVAARCADGSVRYSSEPSAEDMSVDIVTLLPVDFSAFDERDYVHSKEDSWRFGHLLVGRGCPGRCTYCDQSVFGRKLQLAETDKIVADMLHRRKTYRTDHMYFFDDTLLWNKKSIVEICERISATKELAGITWGCNARPNLTDDTVLAAMKKAGCTTVTLGIESGSEETLRQIRKNIDPATMTACIDAIIRNGMTVQVNLMFGFPWDNAETARTHLEFTRTLLKPGVSGFSAGYTVFPYPGTELFETSKDKNYPLHNWWLRDDFFAKNNAATLYQTTAKQPYFRNLVPGEPMVSASQDFFNVYRDTTVKKNVERALREMQAWSLRNNNGRFLRIGIVRCVIGVVGSVLFFVSPGLERYFWRLVLRR